MRLFYINFKKSISNTRAAIYFQKGESLRDNNISKTLNFNLDERKRRLFPNRIQSISALAQIKIKTPEIDTAIDGDGHYRIDNGA